MTEEVQPASGLSRRAIVKGAAWSLPVVAVAVATPLAAASTPTDPTLAWTADTTALLSLQLLDGGGTVQAGALVTVPTEYTFTNGSTALNGETATISVAVGRPAGINIPVGRARGFGVYSVNGVPTASGARTAVYQTAPIVGQYGFPTTTWTGTSSLTVPSNGTLVVPVAFGLAGTSTGVSISALASFPVTLTIVVGGNTYTASSTVLVPVGAGIL